MDVYEYLAELINSQLEGYIPQAIPEGISFDELVDIAKRNHITYLLFSALMRSGSLTKDEYIFCQNQVLKSITTSLAQTNDLKKWISECEARGIVNHPMKGAVLKYIYPNPEMREMSDIDILIEESSMDKAISLLTDMGYSLNRAVKHHDIYVKKPLMVIEAHRSMYDKHVDRTQFEYFDGFSKAILKGENKYTYNFTDEDFYVYMVAHIAKHFYEMGCGIRNLIDVYVYRKKFAGKLNQQYLDEEFSYCGLSNFVNYIEKLAFNWLGGMDFKEEIAEMKVFYSDLFQYMCDSGIYGKDANGIWNKFADEQLADATETYLKKWYYFPPVSYMVKYYTWLEKWPWLLPIAWFVRGCRGLFLHKGEQKREMVSDINQDDIVKYQRIYKNMNLKFKG